MLITRDDSEFEIRICTVDGEWEGRVVEYNLSRLTPTLHLRHNWLALEAALAGVCRRWQRLFPEEAVEEYPDFREAVTTYEPPLATAPFPHADFYGYGAP